MSTALAERLKAHKEEYEDYLPVTERVQADLKEDVDILAAQEGWDKGVKTGVEEWVGDKGMIWRALRRNRYDPDKTLSSLLSTLTHRLRLSLHSPIPTTNTYSTSPLVHILPFPRFTSILGQPVVVITPRELRRDPTVDREEELEEVTEWGWWMLEMIRRVLKGLADSGDSYKAGGGIDAGGGTGCVLVIDAEGAGYKNLQVDLLPNLLSIGHTHFPGLFDSIHVVNAGWTHRSMWTVVKRLLPKSVLDKVRFMDSHQAIAEVFDLERLPQYLGGKDPWTFSCENNAVLQYHSRRLASHVLSNLPSSTSRASPTAEPAHSPTPIKPSASSTSIADIFYTAPPSPSSRVGSRRGSISAGVKGGINALNDLRMTKAGRDGPRPYHRKPAQIDTSDEMTTLQRIKSLTDFHLYLSPSRLAHIDLLSDSDSDPASPGDRGDPLDAVIPEVILPITETQRRLTLRPVVVDPEATIRAKSLADRRARPPLRLIGVGTGKGEGAGDSVRSYSDRLSLHHAHILKGYQRPGINGDGEKVAGTGATNEKVNDENEPGEVIAAEKSHSALATVSPANALEDGLPTSARAPSVSAEPKAQAVSAYSRSLNPWFGYPAVRLATPAHSLSQHIIPLYPRRRKRDLVKTLLFLFMLRLQSLRDNIETILGLYHLGSIPWTRRRLAKVAEGPEEGLKLQNERERRVRRVGWKEKGEWVWVVIGLTVFRGSWMGVLEGMGLSGVRDVLGFG